MGGGRDNHFQNNIQINSGANGKGIHHDNRGEGWAVNAGSVPDGNNYAEWAALKNDNRFNASVWSKKYPELMNMSLRTETKSYGGKTYNACVDALKPDHAVITGNILVGVANPLGNISNRVKELGTVKDNTTYQAGTDIGFVNADGQNFEVRTDSKIKELLGNEHFQASEAGLYVDEYRRNLGVSVTAPTAKSPENNAQVSIASGVTFSWQAGEGAGSYLLEISESDDFASLVFSASTRQTNLQVLDLEKSKTYFWRVTAFEDRLGGNSAVSGVFSFSTTNSDEVVLYESFGDANFSLWSADGGTPTRTDSAAHAGRYSYLVDESRDVIQMRFASPQKQTVSLWLYDTMEAKEGSVVVANAAPSNDGWAALGVNARISTDHYIFRTGTTWTSTAVSRSEGWHELKWDYTGNECKMYIDGTPVHTLENVSGLTNSSWATSGASKASQEMWVRSCSTT